MDENTQEFISYDDENARDEFSASYFFQNNTKNNEKLNGIPMLKRPRRHLQDISNTNYNSTNEELNEKSAVVNANFFNQRSKLKPYRKQISSVHTNSEFIVKKKRKEDHNNTENYHQKILSINTNNETVDNFFLPVKRDIVTKISTDPSYGPMIMEFDDLDDFSIAYNVSQAFQNPANGYNTIYRNHIVVVEPSGKSELARVTELSNAWKAVMDSSIIDRRVLLTSPRKYCSPREQFEIISTKQYKSLCLIRSYFCLNPRIDSIFSNTAVLDSIHRLARKYTNVNSLLPVTTNTSHFHELFLEKLHCNEHFDFMPVSPKLTGSILGGFVNDLFEVSNQKFIPNEVIHVAVDYIYQYLSRVHNVPLIDIRWITLGAIWIAAKNEGIHILDVIFELAGCKLQQMRKAELRLLMVIDFNLTKPHAINFRNRFLVIEQSNSTILHLSSFILDMSLHCYTLMLLPASRRAAAAIWLARLIDMFEGIRFNDEIWSNESTAKFKMDSVWPKHFEKMTGYKHSDISLLALKMHVIIITFISGGEPQYPSVSACHDKYSHLKYGELTTSYEKFTARTVFYASKLYCRLHDLELENWMERNEYETLWRNFSDHKVQFRTNNSCPAELMLKSIVAIPPDSVNTNPIPGDSGISGSNYKLQKFDSGYSTQSSTMGDF